MRGGDGEDENEGEGLHIKCKLYYLLGRIESDCQEINYRVGGGCRARSEAGKAPHMDN